MEKLEDTEMKLKFNYEKLKNLENILNNKEDEIAMKDREMEYQKE